MTVLLLGVPLAWMLANEGTEAMFKHFLRTFRTANPEAIPRFFMSDKDRAQMNAISVVYPEPQTKLLLCWWHVLHAWQQHFRITEFPELWTLLKSWIRIADPTEFEAHWLKIQQLEEAPPSFIKYLKTNWMNETQLWSAVYRKSRSIHELSDTNMLIEA